MIAGNNCVLDSVAGQYCSNIVASVNQCEISQIQGDLLKWYALNRRRLPWRGDDTSIPRSAYGTWISEVMLQQTRVETVIAYWNRWMQTYPDISSLANATPDEVNALWAGLGYYRRAQMLLKGAQMVVKEFNGDLPQKVSELLTIPGIGPYTAGAIASIAYNQSEPLVDGNVIRVFSRLRALKLEVGGGAMEKACWRIAADLVSQDQPGDFNQALMELGATVCKPTSPSCDVCPLRSVCHARLLVDHAKRIDSLRTESPGDKNPSGRKRNVLDLHTVPSKQTIATISVIDIEDIDTERAVKISSAAVPYDVSLLPRDVTEFPRKIAKKKAKELSFSVCVLRTLDGSSSSPQVKSELPSKSAGSRSYRYLFVRRPATGLLANQWEFPSLLLETEADEGAAEGVEGDTAARAGADKIPSQQQPLESDLWAPFPNYFSGQLCISWKTQPVSGNAEAGENVKEEELGAVVGGGLSVLEIGKVSGFEPIIHVFSHQRHTMHILLKDVQVVSSAAADTEKTSVASVESRWMSAEEIVAAGITTGCKKVLTEVSKVRDGAATTATSIQKAATKRAAKVKVKDEKKVEKLKAETDLADEIASDDEKCDVSAPKNAFDVMKFNAKAAPVKKRPKKA